MQLSVVIPVFNEEKNIEELYQELESILSGIGKQFEIIFIDDGSTDDSFTLLKRMQKKDDRVVVIKLRKNFGQTAALSAGFDHAVGDIVITMDGDLQNDPKDIPKLLKIIEEGFDMACGWRFNRKDRFINRRLPSMLANKIISWTTNVKLHDYGCTLKAFRKEVVEGINLYGEMHRFIPAVASTMGVSIEEVKVNHRARKYGTSKYGISRTIRVILDLITIKFLLSYATRPIQIFGLLGFFSAMGGSGLVILMAIQRQVYKIPMANRPLLLLAILLIFIGLQFVTLGLLGELQARTYHETQNKPIYVIRNILKGENKP